MNETNENEILEAIKAKPEFMLILFINPLCGRCEIAERSLEQVLPQLPSFPVYKCNIYYSPKIVETLKVSSAPSFKFLVNGEVVHSAFGIRSADDLYYSIKIFLKEQSNPYQDFEWE